MSVIALGPEQYQKIINTLLIGGYTFNGNENQISSLVSLSRSGVDIYKSVEKMVKQWFRLNELTYIKAYGQREEVDKNLLSDFFDLKYDKAKGYLTNRVALYKALQCIIYNIDIEDILELITEEEKESFESLQIIFKQVSHMIISQLPEYKEAEYADF